MLYLFNVCICLLIHPQSAISKVGKRKLEGCTREGIENKKIRSDMAMNKDDTELDASPPNAAVNDVVVERAKDDVCVDSKVETTNAPQEPEETIAASPLDAAATPVETDVITYPTPTNDTNDCPLPNQDGELSHKPMDVSDMEKVNNDDCK